MPMGTYQQLLSKLTTTKLLPERSEETYEEDKKVLKCQIKLPLINPKPKMSESGTAGVGIIDNSILKCP